MKIGPELVRHVATLAALELSDAETSAMSSQLTRIVEHFEALRAIPDDELPVSAPVPASPLRDDVPRDAAIGAVLAANAPELAHGHFVVPRVVSRGPAAG